MIIFPAIDIKDRQCVRLYKGEFSKAEIVSANIVETAKRMQDDGAEFIHIVDLDGALKGKPQNLDIISEIIKNIDIPVEIGGGIRNIETVEEILNIGASRVILGTAALGNRNFVKEAIKKYGGKIVIGIDANNRKVAIEGWQTVSNVDFIEFAKDMEQMGVETIIFTDISRDGTLEGPNLDQLAEINESVGCNIIASGGIKTIDDILNLKKLGLYGAITGKAIYSGTLDLKEAINAGRE